MIKVCYVHLNYYMVRKKEYQNENQMKELYSTRIGGSFLYAVDFFAYKSGEIK
jgi:hypothetical protein